MAKVLKIYRGDGLNLYAYVKNNPVMWVDASGYMAHQKNKDTFLDNGSRTNWCPEHGKGNVKHNNATEQVLDWAESQGATNITKNKQQVNVSGEKVSTKRPDAAYTIDGQRYNTNYVSNYQLDKHDELVRELENFKNMMNADPDAITSLVFNYDFF